MAAWLKQKWKYLSTHQVWSNVIAGALLLMGVQVITQLVKGIRAVVQSPVTGQLTTAIGRWALTPIPTARILVLISNLAEGALVGVVIAAIYTGRRREQRRLAELAQTQTTVDEVARRLAAAAARERQITQEVVQETQRNLQARLQELREQAAIRGIATGPEGCAEKPSSLELANDLSSHELTSLKYLYASYPNTLPLRNLTGVLGVSYAKAEQLAQRVETRGLLRIVNNPWHGVQVCLTEEGRDLCIMLGDGE